MQQLHILLNVYPYCVKSGVPMNSRKLLVVDTVLDYDYTGPNPKHDPRKGKPVNVGKNL